MNLKLSQLLFLFCAIFYCVESLNDTSSSYESTTSFNSSLGLNSTSSSFHSNWTSSSNSTDLNINGYLDFCINHCNGEHQVCVDNECQCHPQYTWNVNTSTCEYITCNKSIECQIYDQNRFCNLGSCICSENTKQSTENGLKCTAIKCSSLTECPNFSCVRGICECDLNSGFRMNEERGECERFKCSNSTECQTYDSNRFCDITDGMCKCKDTYTEDLRDGNKCKSTFCYGESITCQGQNQICSAEHCYCDENSTLSEITGKCELNSCENSTDCESIDGNSFCSDGICKCNENHIKSHDKCVPRTCAIPYIYCTANSSFCVDNRCQCEPNTRYSNISGRCESFSCQHSYECQEYDENRYCSNGSCHCVDMFVHDSENGYKCKPTSCDTKDDCSLNNSICLNNKCGCAPDHFYNVTTRKCEYYECVSSSQCYNSLINPFDQRICDSGKCICRNGSNPDQSNGGKCIVESTSFHNYCSSDRYCDNGEGSEKCVDSLCQCSPDYKYNYDLKRCRKFVCNQMNDCTDYDLERVCRDGQCVCGDNYVENKQNGGLCNKKSVTYEKYCSANYDCYEGNQRCVDSLCRCKPNFAWNSNTQKCEYFLCNTVLGYSCWTSYDNYRSCDPFGAGCVCDSSYWQDTSNGDKCVYKPPIFPTFTPITYTPTTYTYDYTYLYVFIPIVFVVSLLSACFRVRRTVNRTKPAVHTANASPPPPAYTP